MIKNKNLKNKKNNLIIAIQQKAFTVVFIVIQRSKKKNKGILKK
jgi:hypothetical protein